MKVRCERLLNPATCEQIQRSSHLTVGREYLVLSVIAQPGKRVLLRLIDDDGGTQSVWDARMFMTTSSRIPGAWGIRLDADGVLTLGPQAWQRNGFWEAYFDAEPWAVTAFRAGIATMREDPD
jgi:hypothetical protein